MLMEFFFNTIWLIPLYPFLAFAIIVLGLNRNKKASAGLAIASMVLATIHSWIIVFAAARAYMADAHHGVHIDVSTALLQERTDPAASEWFYVYTVTISNRGEETVKLLSRHWIITDANGRVEEVRGPGVVGKQPELEPGESFEYTSGCPLPTAFGTMHGSYQMVTPDGQSFEAPIPPFALGEPDVVH